MSSTTRWVLAVLMAILLVGGTIIISLGGLVIMVMGTDSCAGISSLPVWANYYPFLPPSIMILGSLVGSLMLGLNKRWYIWVGTIVASGVVSVISAVAWFPIIGALC